MPAAPASNTTHTPTPAAPDAAAPVRFDTKIAVLLRDDLAGWQRLNVTAFVTSALAAAYPDLIGDGYRDADGVGYLPMLGQPVLVFEGDLGLLRRAHAGALRRGIPMAIFTEQLFHTGNDRDNRAAVRTVATHQLDLVGLAVHAQRNAVDRLVKGARLHP